MKRVLPLALAIGLLSAGALMAESRTWTSASNPDQKLQGELMGVSGDQITVQFEGREPSQFELSFFSEADREYVASVKNEFVGAAPVPTAGTAAPAAAGSIYRDAAGNLAGGGVRPAKYYLLYFAAST